MGFDSARPQPLPSHSPTELTNRRKCAVRDVVDKKACEISVGADCGHSASHENGEGQADNGAPPRQQHLKLIPLAILVFYNVSGGPFGLETSVRAGGNLFAILGLLILPFVFSVPEALVTAELGSTFPEASGGVAWVEEAFGQKAGLISGYLNWISGATDNAIYPALFLEYLTSIMSHLTAYEKEELASGWARFLFVCLMTILLAGVNYTGLEIVGTSSVVVCAVAMSPFVIMCLVGIPQVNPHKWFLLPESTESVYNLFDDDAQTASGPIPLFVFAGVLWRPFLNNMFWNLNSFDAAASFAGEVRDVSTTYPRGIFLGLALIMAFYIFPLLVAIGATNSTQAEWVDGHLASIAYEIGGNWFGDVGAKLLGGWTVFAAGVSNIALFEAEMSADSFLLMGMAERGFLPKFLQKRSVKYGTPVYGILIGTIVVICMSMANFSQLVEMLNFNYSASLLMEYAAFVKLRYSHADVTRPYKVPVPDWATVLVIIPPCVMIVFLMLLSSWMTFAYVVAVYTLGIGLFILQHLARNRGWCEFEGARYSQGCTATASAEQTRGGLSSLEFETEDDNEDAKDACSEDEELVESGNGVMT